MTSKWPRILLEDGPAQAGFAPGDSLSLNPDWWLHFSAVYWTADRLVLSVHQVADGMTNGDAWRYSSTTDRFEYINYGGNSSSGAKWGPLKDPLVKLGSRSSTSAREHWVFRLVDDGPAVACVKRFGPHTCVNPVSLDGGGGSKVATARWTLLHPDGTLGELEVRESLEGALETEPKQRRVGVSLFWPPEDFQKLDKEIAKGIVAQMQPQQAPASWVDFDGVVRNHGENASRHGSVAGLFWELTRGRYPKGDDENAQAQRELDETRTATPAEVTGVVRALRPFEWARERQLREECATLPR